MKKLDENNETFRHDTVSHESRTVVHQARMTKNMTQTQLTTTMREQRAITNEYESGKATPNDTILTAADLEKFFVERTKEG